MNSVKLRAMVDADLPEVSALDAELFGPSKWNRSTFASELRAPWRHYVVAVSGEEILGYAGIAIGDTAQVMTIGVALGAQRRGIGRQLFADLLREAKECGCKEVILEVRMDGQAAQAMYREFGFAGIGIRKNYYQAEGIDALVMKKILAPRIGPVGSEVTT